MTDRFSELTTVARMADENLKDFTDVLEDELFAQLAVQRLGLDVPMPPRDKVRVLAELVADALNHVFRFERGRSRGRT